MHDPADARGPPSVGNGRLSSRARGLLREGISLPPWFLLPGAWIASVHAVILTTNGDASTTVEDVSVPLTRAAVWTRFRPRAS